MQNHHPGLFPPTDDLLFFEKGLWSRGHRYIAGCDEAGRGPLAGPVVAAAVVLEPGTELPGVTDSKLMSDRRRREALPRIIAAARAVAAASIDARDIDRLNILEASKAAMALALDRLGLSVTHVLVDGNQPLRIQTAQTTVVGGDRRSLSIAAASIVAKVIRDDIMVAMHERWPGYGFDRNRGYPSREHRQALETQGICAIHRKSYKPVRDAAS